MKEAWTPEVILAINLNKLLKVMLSLHTSKLQRFEDIGQDLFFASLWSLHAHDPTQIPDIPTIPELLNSWTS